MWYTKCEPTRESYFWSVLVSAIREQGNIPPVRDGRGCFLSSAVKLIKQGGMRKHPPFLLFALSKIALRVPGVQVLRHPVNVVHHLHRVPEHKCIHLSSGMLRIRVSGSPFPPPPNKKAPSPGACIMK